MSKGTRREMVAAEIRYGCGCRAGVSRNRRTGAGTRWTDSSQCRGEEVCELRVVRGRVGIRILPDTEQSYAHEAHT